MTRFIRAPRGVPEGGQFVATRRAETETALTSQGLMQG